MKCLPVEAMRVVREREPSLVDNEAVLPDEGCESSDEESAEPDPRRDLRSEAVSTRHLLTHRPKTLIARLAFAARCSVPLVDVVLCQATALGLKSSVAFAHPITSSPTMSYLVACMVKKRSWVWIFLLGGRSGIQ